MQPASIPSLPLQVTSFLIKFHFPGTPQTPSMAKSIFRNPRHMDSSHSWYNQDIVVEVLRHLDAKSLSMAGCVNRQWKRAVETESLWEGVCTKRCPAAGESLNMRSVVMALGGYRRFFFLCLRPLLYRPASYIVPTSCFKQPDFDLQDGLIPLSLSLLSMDCYERLGGKKGYLGDDEPSAGPVGRYTLEI